MNTITWSDFEKIEIRIGTIIEVHDFPEAKKNSLSAYNRFWK